MGFDRKRKLLAAVSMPLAMLCWVRTASGQQETKPSEAQAWGESPFLAERGGPKPAVTGEAASGEPVFVLKGILWDARSPSAIVNDHVVSPGDRLGRWHVVEIQKNKVVLSDDTTTQEIYAQ